MKDYWQLRADLTTKLPCDLNYWLFQVQRLGLELKSILPNVALRKLTQFDGVMTDDEQVLLKTAYKQCHIRLAKHYHQTQTIVLARTIIPWGTYQCYRHVFDHLGDKSIGEGFLFRAPAIKRSPFYAKHFSAKVFYDRFPGQNFHCDHNTWARASLFFLEPSYNLLVEEFFLQMPALHHGSIHKETQEYL